LSADPGDPDARPTGDTASRRIRREERELARTVVADIERFGRSAARIAARGPEAFFDPDDDVLRRAGRSVIIDVSAAIDRLPEAVRDAHPEIPWRAIRTTRNIIAHAYDDVNEEYIWEALHTGIPQLVEGLQGWRRSARKEPS
jgi:uncharacterized protein with HEPN domain